jgi:MYXO-CTERM domain-containing protein
VLDTPALKLITPGSGASGESPTIACGSASCLVSYLDRGYPNDQTPDLRGVRLGFDGQVLDTVPLTLVARPGWQGNPRLAWHGSSYLLVYTDNDRDSWNPDLYGALIAADGAVTKAPFLISEGDGDRPRLALTWTGTHFLAAWDTFAMQHSRADVRGARVTEAGVVVDLPAQSLVSTHYADRQPGLASLGGGTAALAYWRFDDAAGLGSERVKVRLFDNSPVSDAGAPGLDASGDTMPALSPDAGVDAAADLASDAAPIADTAIVIDQASDLLAPPADAGAAEIAGPTLDTSAPDAGPSPLATDASAGPDVGAAGAVKTKSSGCSCTTAGNRSPEGGARILMTALLAPALAVSLRRRRRR